MIKNDSWMNALFSLVFIAVPALIMYYFLLPDWTGKEVVTYPYIWLISFSFLAYVALLSFLLIRFNILSFQSLNFNVPLALCLVLIFVTYDVDLWGRALILIAGILTALPMNMITDKYKK